MALYVPRLFNAQSLQDSVALIRARPFATLITTIAEGEPQITHLPLLWVPGGECGALSGHVARANPHWQRFAGAHTVAVFHGPHAYISPNWYAQPEREVPTWNYATVHAQGTPVLVEDRDEKLAMIDTLSAHFEDGLPKPWTRGLDAARLEALLGGLVTFRIPLTRLDAKFKFNQNKTAADRAGVIAALDAQGDDESRAVADWMRGRD